MYDTAHVYSTIHGEKVRTSSVEKQILVNTMATKFEIEKSNVNNFSLWKLKIKAILRKDNYLPAIEGRPAGLANDKWKEMDDNVVANLHWALADSILLSIAEKKMAKEIWDALVWIVWDPVTSQKNIFKEKTVFSSNEWIHIGDGSHQQSE